MPLALLIMYCLLIVGASILGGLLPLWLRLTHQRMQLALSFVSGVMLGVALMHLLPHAWVEWRQARGPEADISALLLWLLGGFLALFLLERFFSFHHHEVEVGEQGRLRIADEPGDDDSAACTHHGDHPHPDHNHGPARGRVLSWSGAFLGLAVHSILNGVALAASVVAATHAAGEAWLGLAGLATFLVIFLHKPFDALTIGTLMAAAGRPRKSRHAINALFALMVPAGAALFGLGLELSHESAHEFIAVVLALSAGMFMCIALSDLLPELHFHAHDRIKLTAALLAGLALAYVISIAEGELHHHDHGQAGQSADIDFEHID